MPQAKELSIEEGYGVRTTYVWYKETNDKAMWECISQNMLIPLDWLHARCGPIMEQLPTESLVQLPMAIYTSGVSLTSFQIYLPAPGNISDLALEKEDIHVLAAAMQKLQHFKLSLYLYQDGSVDD